MPTLNRISVTGFKSIREMFRFELRHLNVLIGANGAGKSNFISVFDLLHRVVDSQLKGTVRRRGGADTFLYFGRKVTERIIIRLEFGRNGYEIKLVPSSTDALVIEEEECWFHNPNYPQPYTVHLSAGAEEAGLLDKARTEPVAKHVAEGLLSWRVYHFHDTSDSAKVKHIGDIGDNRFLRSNAENLAAFLYLLQQRNPDYYERIVDTIRLAAPFFSDFSLQPLAENPNKIRLEWREKDSDLYFDASYLSDGTLRFICLSTLLLQPDPPSTILIDEPELGLHPYAINLLAEMLRSAAVTTQVIVSTQSVPLINQLSPEDVVIVDREDNQSVFKRLDARQLEEWLEEYGLGELWEKNIIGGRP